MTEQIIALAIAMGASESQREILEPLCAAAERTLAAQLRPGLTPQDCTDAFVVCAAWMALDGLHAAGGGSGVTSFTAGDVSIQTGNSGDTGRLTQQIQRLMAPYLTDGGFYFQGVTG